MTLTLSTPAGSLSAAVERVIVRVEQDYKPDGSIVLTIHTAEWLTLPDGKREIGQWVRHSATYHDIETMVQLTALTWAPSQATREALAAEILTGEEGAASAVLGAYGEILSAAKAAIAARDAQQPPQPQPTPTQ
jgi:hypothetical protein